MDRQSEGAVPLNAAAAPSRLRRWLHWLIAAGVVVMAALGLVMTRRDGLLLGGEVRLETRITLYSLHKTLGLALAAFIVWRLAIVWRHGLLRSAHSASEVIAARFAAGLLLSSLVLMPLTGLLQHMLVQGSAPVWGLPLGGLLGSDPDLSSRLGAAHRAVAWLMLGVVLIHAAGALKHHLIDRDATLQRMLRGGAASVAASIDLPRGAGVAPLAGAAVAIMAACAGAWAWSSGGPQAPAAKAMLTAGTWTMDRARSRLEIEATAAGETFKARFERFETRIVLDPANLKAAVIEAVIDVASFASGLPDRDASAKDGDWLDAAKFPHARFTASGLTEGADGRLSAAGKLKIRDWEAPVTLAFSLAISGDTAHAQGEALFDRFDMKLGQGATGDEDMAGRRIRVIVDIHARRH